MKTLSLLAALLALGACLPQKSDSSSDGGSRPSSTDASTIDRTNSSSTDGGDAAMGVMRQDGALAGCVRGVYGTYVLRADGIALHEPFLAGKPEQTILDAITGMPLTGITSVQDGTYHGCATLSNGSVDCWQTDATSGNTYGQLGNGTTDVSSALYRATPVLMAVGTPLANAVALAAGVSNNSCAIETDGKLSCWGDLTWIINKGTALRSGYAQAITTDGTTPLTGALQAASGTGQACAVVQGSPNSVWCWGNNRYDELAQADMMGRQYPIKVLGLTNPTKVTISPVQDWAGGQNGAGTICVLDGGNVRCWGFNVNNTAGVSGTRSPIPSPTLVVTQDGVTALGGVVDIEPGSLAFSALRAGGALSIWGYGLRYSADYGLNNIAAIGWGGGDPTPGGTGGPPRFLTRDGVYHHGADTTIPVNCSVLP